MVSDTRPGRPECLAWIVHYRGCWACMFGPELCSIGVRLSGLVMAGMAPDESLLCLVNGAKVGN